MTGQTSGNTAYCLIVLEDCRRTAVKNASRLPAQERAGLVVARRENCMTSQGFTGIAHVTLSPSTLVARQSMEGVSSKTVPGGRTASIVMVSGDGPLFFIVRS